MNPQHMAEFTLRSNCLETLAHHGRFHRDYEIAARVDITRGDVDVGRLVAQRFAWPQFDLNAIVPTRNLDRVAAVNRRRRLELLTRR
jgi:hypothetical protein